MSATRLVYFNLTGLGEPIRFLLSYCGEKFEDERINLEDWKDRKENFPYGKLPYLEIDGLKLHQSMAICRYIARKHELTGKTPADATQADIMADTVRDILNGLAGNFWEQDAVLKEKRREEVLKNAEFYLDRLENEVKDNGGHLVKGQLTWADFVFAPLSLYMSHISGKDLFTTRPALLQIREKVLALPSIQTYIKSRPPHPF